MAAPKQHKVADSLQEWQLKGDPSKVLRTFTMVAKRGDRVFVKIFPDLIKAVLAAMRDKKLEGSGDLFFYFLGRLMTVRVNGTEQEIDIRATAEEIAEATGKSIRAVRKNLATLLLLGFLQQPNRGTPLYIVPPDLAYRGSLRKLREREAQRGAKPMDQVFREMKALRPKKS